MPTPVFSIVDVRACDQRRFLKTRPAVFLIPLCEIAGGKGRSKPLRHQPPPAPQPSLLGRRCDLEQLDRVRIENASANALRNVE
jgi:hypothetical protein